MDEQSRGLRELLIFYKGYLGSVNAPRPIFEAVEGMVSALENERPIEPAHLQMVRSLS